MQFSFSYALHMFKIWNSSHQIPNSKHDQLISFVIIHFRSCRCTNFSHSSRTLFHNRAEQNVIFNWINWKQQQPKRIKKIDQLHNAVKIANSHPIQAFGHFFFSNWNSYTSECGWNAFACSVDGIFFIHRWNGFFWFDVCVFFSL